LLVGIRQLTKGIATSKGKEVKVVKYKEDDIKAGFTVGNLAVWDSAVADIEEHGYALVVSSMDEILTFNSVEALEKHFNMK
jgi:hypothetical protein